MYHCVVCGTPLFYSESKFHSDFGWPSFDRPVKAQNVKYEGDYSLGMRRVEVTCATCGAHLSHVFDGGPTATHKRYCINSLALEFTPNNHYSFVVVYASNWRVLSLFHLISASLK